MHYTPNSTSLNLWIWMVLWLAHPLQVYEVSKLSHQLPETLYLCTLFLLSTLLTSDVAKDPPQLDPVQWRASSSSLDGLMRSRMTCMCHSWIVNLSLLHNFHIYLYVDKIVEREYPRNFHETLRSRSRLPFPSRGGTIPQKQELWTTIPQESYHFYSHHTR